MRRRVNRLHIREITETAWTYLCAWRKGQEHVGCILISLTRGPKSSCGDPKPDGATLHKIRPTGMKNPYAIPVYSREHGINNLQEEQQHTHPLKVWSALSHLTYIFTCRFSRQNIRDMNGPSGLTNTYFVFAPPHHNRQQHHQGTLGPR